MFTVRIQGTLKLQQVQVWAWHELLSPLLLRQQSFCYQGVAHRFILARWRLPRVSIDRRPNVLREQMPVCTVLYCSLLFCLFCDVLCPQADLCQLLLMLGFLVAITMYW